MCCFVLRGLRGFRSYVGFSDFSVCRLYGRGPRMYCRIQCFGSLDVETIGLGGYKVSKVLRLAAVV